jgi:hypothetical protein
VERKRGVSGRAKLSGMNMVECDRVEAQIGIVRTLNTASNAAILRPPDPLGAEKIKKEDSPMIKGESSPNSLSVGTRVMICLIRGRIGFKRGDDVTIRYSRIG